MSMKTFCLSKSMKNRAIKNNIMSYTLYIVFSILFFVSISSYTLTRYTDDDKDTRTYGRKYRGWVRKHYGWSHIIEILKWNEQKKKINEKTKITWKPKMKQRRWLLRFIWLLCQECVFDFSVSNAKDTRTMWTKWISKQNLSFVLKESGRENAAAAKKTTWQSNYRK